MKTKIFTLLFAVAASVGTMFAESGTCGENLTWDLTDGVLTISGTGAMEDYPYSSEVPWYSYNEAIKSVKITDGVTSIGNYAFCDCSGLSSIEIPNSVTSIGNFTFFNCAGLKSIEIPNSVTAIGEGSFYNCIGLTTIEIPNSVTNVGSSAFFGCVNLASVNLSNKLDSISGDYGAPFSFCFNLTTIEIPNSVKTIKNGFVKCSLKNIIIGTGLESILITDLLHVEAEPVLDSLGFLKDGFGGPEIIYNVDKDGNLICSTKSIVCHTTVPPVVEGDIQYIFCYYDGRYRGIDPEQLKDIVVYVPAGNVAAYKADAFWGQLNIRPMDAKQTEVTEVKVTPAESEVEVAWPVVAGAYTYELVIKDKSGNVICTLVFNAQGQLISIAFNAPSRDGAPQQTQTAGFAFTVTGLEAGTSYDLTITAKDSNGTNLDTQTVSFTTQAPQGIDDINAATKSQKIVRDNQILILRGDKTYTLTGQEVK